MESGEQDRSEKPTTYRLRKAREQGSVARGTDLAFLVALCVFLGFLLVEGPGLAAAVEGASQDTLRLAPGLNDAASLLPLIALVAGRVAPWLATLIAAAFLAILLFELVQTGVVFSATPLKPDFARLSPARGFKRVFSLRILIETAKGILKLAFYAGVAVLVIRAAVEKSVVLDGRDLLRTFDTSLLHLLEAFVGIALLVAGLDQLVARRDFLKRMRMSRREVKREHREREGDPRIIQKRRRLHREFVKQTQSLRNVAGSDVMITNPTHIAIALKYDAARMEAPWIVARGSNAFALRLRSTAFRYGVLIVEDRELARALHAAGDINVPIPGGTFRAVADIYRKLNKARSEVREQV